MLNDEEIVPVAPSEPVEPIAPTEPTEPVSEDYRAKLNAQNRFLEKEGYTFSDGKWVPPAPKAPVPQEGSMSAKDTLALVGAGITAEADVDEVLNFAGYRKVSVTEALKDKLLISVLAERAEERKSAKASNTKSARGTTQVTGSDLLDRARQGGEIHETDIEKLAEARILQRKAKTQ